MNKIHLKKLINRKSYQNKKIINNNKAQLNRKLNHILINFF